MGVVVLNADSEVAVVWPNLIVKPAYPIAALQEAEFTAVATELLKAKLVIKPAEPPAAFISEANTKN
jgi:hypothetical protein